MKIKAILTTVYGLAHLYTWAIERPEDIPSRLEEIRVKGWYEDKIRSWQSYLTENQEDTSGWMEYFKAAVYAGYSRDQLRDLAGFGSFRLFSTQ